MKDIFLEMSMAKKQENLKKGSATDLSIVDKSENKPAHNTLT